MPRPAFLVVALGALGAALLLLDPNVLTAVATAVLTIFAGLQIWSERAKRRSEERTAEARLSINAFALRQALADWIKRSREVGWGDAPAKRAQDAITNAMGLRERLERGLIDAASASKAAAARMRTAYAHWQRAMMQFESYLGQEHRLRGAVSPADSAVLTDGVESLHACYLALEPVVEPELAAEAKRLGAGPPI